MKVVLFGLVAAAFLPSSQAQTLPDGPGKPLVERMCKGCHGIENVVRAKRTRDRWTEIVDDMVSRGAVGTDAEIDQVIDYLATHFGADSVRKVNVNKAESAELVSVLGITASDADAIVHYRAEKGSFKSVQDLVKVPGIDAKKIETNQNRIEF